MNIKPDCLVCLYNQALKTTKLLGLDDEMSAKILFEIAKILPNYSLNFTPPQIAKDTYQLIENITNNKDPLQTAKIKSIQEAKSFKPYLYEEINKSDDKLLTALKIAVAGNVIDFGAKEQIPLKKILNDIFNKPFKLDSYNTLKQKLSTAKTLVILGDNSGENIFDVILADVIKSLYDIEIFYFVRGKPIINDVTLKEALNSDMPKFAKIIDTSVPTPGYDLKYANKESLEIFNNADVVISKGMGNFESLFNITNREIFYLFVVKCNVVANAIHCNIADLILSNEFIN
jgi:uncharacterized protein with ATP-grasp and redox domains